MDTTPSYEHILDTIQRRAGLDTPHEALACLHATLGVLAELLYRADRPRLAHALPDELAEVLLQAPQEGLDLDAETFFARVGAQENVRPGFAAEHAQIVLQVIAEHTSPDLHRFLENRLPDDIASWLRPRRSTTAPHTPLRLAAAQGARTLAAGRPGGTHPLAEAHPDNAHTHSIARSDDPHGDRKLSGAHRAGGSANPLADGHPDTGRQIAEFKNG